MKSSPAPSASFASARQSGQLADQRSGTLVAERPDEQLAPNSPILSALPLYMAMRFCIDALRASTAFSPGVSNYHRRDDRGDQGERAAHRRAGGRNLVLPVRIELTTSPLPRECSTTELRQRAHPQMRPTTTSRKRPIA